MRLLECNQAAEFSLTKDFANKNIPQAYAILSHTWGNDGEEVTFDDLQNRTGKDKTGYTKLQFCSKQATRDGLQYFWVDTVCINRSCSAELSKSINSMFRWYSNAAKCYAYLTDVSKSQVDTSDNVCQIPWEEAFRKSRWFKRGWTLQELIAPESVEFFSKEGEYLGSKKSLERQITEVTGIPVLALQGIDPSEFSVAERMAWAQNRETTEEEDEAYSLFGIFGVCIPPLYGEGKTNACIRLWDQIDKASTTRKSSAMLGAARARVSMSSGFGLGDFVAISVLAWDVYKACRDSSGEFQRIDRDVKTLHITMKETEELLEEYKWDLTPSRKERLHLIYESCLESLNKLQALIQKYDGVATSGQRAWDHMRLALQDVSELKQCIISASTKLDAFNHSLSQ
jgi:hypothetical protein